MNARRRHQLKGEVAASLAALTYHSAVQEPDRTKAPFLRP